MGRKTKWLVTLSTVTAIVTALGAYAASVEPNEGPTWLVTRVTKYRPNIYLVVFVLTALGAVIEWIRAIAGQAAANKAAIQELLDDFAREHLTDDPKSHRLTLFKRVSGARAMFTALCRLPLFGHWHKWRALLRLRFNAEYLIVYARATNSRNAKSAVALRVSDRKRECEGVAGLVWDSSFYYVPNAPRLRWTMYEMCETWILCLPIIL